MSTSTNVKYPPNLVLVAILSGGLTIGLSLMYILLSVTFIAFRFNCDVISSTTGSGYFWHTIFKVYGSACPESISSPSLTKESTVLILVCITLAISIICLAVAIALVTTVQDERQGRYLTWFIYVYVGSCVVSLIVDVTSASYFGVDYNYLTSLLRDRAPNGSSVNYQLDVIRQGALFLMIIMMKGFVAPLINCIFLILLLIYLVDYQKLVKNSEHPIHKVGVLTAFDQKKSDESWVHPDIYNSSPFTRGPQVNGAYVEDDSPPSSPNRRPVPLRSDYFSHRSFDRSDSWNRPQNNIPQNGRVFSYLEDIRRPAPPKVPNIHTSPGDKPSPWRRDPWLQGQIPPVPVPDYSPTQPRRLKSALKPGYV